MFCPTSYLGTFHHSRLKPWQPLQLVTLSPVCWVRHCAKAMPNLNARSELAMAAGALCVSRLGTQSAMPYRKEVLTLVDG